MEEEIWKAVPGYEGIYEASTLGRIRSLDRLSKWRNNNGTMCRSKIRGRMLKFSVDEDGYFDVDLYDGVNKRAKTCRVNRIIAETFVPNPYNLPQVDHLNGVKDDNRPCNLEWVTCKENVNRAWRDGRCSTDASKLGKRCKCVEDSIEFISISAAAKHYNMKDHVVRAAVLSNSFCTDLTGRIIHFQLID